MRYDEMRRHVLEHFQTRLDNLREQIAAHGPPDDRTQAVMRATLGIAQEAPGDFQGSAAPAELNRAGFARDLKPEKDESHGKEQDGQPLFTGGS
ncbi:hypothetical protein, partial [Loktanella atrilutea]|uniref:hypothetical protein n=1 Tax=Loktanella atrilutea TaxID=366533 RepID=UPI001C4A184C